MINDRKRKYDITYVRINYKQYWLKLRRGKDAKLIKHIAKQPNANQYLKGLVAQDLKKKSK
ncbi:MAG: hypothetical protein KBT03_07650 [Bacteroidales bacterium]|nr:hypothetical protein [Candidatus Scybalousia scybalohippi]